MSDKLVAIRHFFQRDKYTVLLLAGLTVLLLLASSRHIGMAWDEPAYVLASEIYPRWFDELFTQPQLALSKEGITTYWQFNSEHPPVGKIWAGFVWLGARHLFDDLTAHRLGNILLVGLLVAALYLFLAREFNRTAGLAAVAALLTMPRFFFHAHLSSLDIPVTVMIFIVTYIFWLSRNRPAFRWTLFLGLVWGVAVSTKINALFIPPLLFSVWTLIFQPRLYLFVRLGIMGFIGIVYFIVSWPWLYYDTIDRLVAYLGFLTTERPFPMTQFYFGEIHSPPPWHFPFVTALIVVPAALIFLAAIGAFDALRKKEARSLGGLFLLGAFFSLLVLASGKSLVYDNDRLMMPVFPYLAALAGIGFTRLMDMLQQLAANRGIGLRKTKITALATIILFGPHLLLAYDLYPHLLSYYSEAIGGAYGAKVLNLETTYYCETYSQMLPYLNANAPSNATVWAECQDILHYYQKEGRLRSDLHIVNAPNNPDVATAFLGTPTKPVTIDEADYVVIQYRQSGFVRPIRLWVESREPAYELKYRRLRLAEIYVR